MKVRSLQESLLRRVRLSSSQSITGLLLPPVNTSTDYQTCLSAEYDDELYYHLSYLATLQSTQKYFYALVFFNQHRLFPLWYE